MISLKWLGPPRIEIDGRAVSPALRWRKNLALCVLLWTERTHPLPRDRLIDWFWPDSDEVAGRHSLNEALRVIRRGFGDHAVRTDHMSVQWLIECDCDLVAFEAMLETNPLATAALISGEWCEGLSVPDAPGIDDWLSTERRRWNSRLVAALTTAANLASDHGDLRLAHDQAMLAHRIDSWHDPAARALMRVQALSGDRAGALATAEHHARRLSDDLGVAPEAATALLAEVIGKGRLTGQQTRARIADQAVLPFVGAGDRLADACHLWDDVRRHGSARSLVILGRAGMGRTRFLSELSARVRLDGGTVVRVNAMPSDARDSAPSLGHLADALLHEAPGLGATEPGAISALVASRPAWAERFPSVVPSGEVSLLDAITAAVHASAGDRPLMIAIDDAGCLHPAAREALLALCRASDHTALLVAVTGEMVEGEDSVAELARASGTALPGLVVIIAPLVAGDIALLVADALPAWPPEAQDRLVRRLVDESAGSPLIVSAILDAVRAGLLVTDAGTVWPVADRTLDASLPAAPSAAFTLAVRHAFRRLPLPEGEVLRWLAAVPGPMSEADLRVLAKELPDLASVLDSLEATGWVESDVRGYRITARAIGRCIREDAMTPGQRRRMLAQWGDRNS